MAQLSCGMLGMTRLLPRSLQGRMLLASVVATALALAIAGAVIAGLLGRFVTQGLDRQLDAQLLMLSSTVDLDGHVDRARLTQQTGAFGQEPGWQWQITGPDGTFGDIDVLAPVLNQPDQSAPPLPPRPPGPRPVDGVGFHARSVTLSTRGGQVTLTAAAPREVIARPIKGALAQLLSALASLAALLTLAMLVQLRIGLRPLRTLGTQVAAIRAGQRAQLDTNQPLELQPLTMELNTLAAETEAALAAARASAANLAHALKTPVATLAIELRDQPRLAAIVESIDRAIRHHLSRARAINRRVTTPLAPAVAGIVTAIERLHREAPLLVDHNIAEDVAVAVDQQDLDELLGNLLDNAARHAASHIVIEAARSDRTVRLTISDDGPGISPSQRTRILHPSPRLDERGDGHGFGLSVVMELTALYGGSLRLVDTKPHGLTVELILPASMGSPHNVSASIR